MIVGWILTLITILIMAIVGDHMSAQLYLFTVILSQVFVMIADAPADGYCVELGKLESIEKRGQILATGQFCRFGFTLLSGVIQTFLIGGPYTNYPGENPFSWGLTFSQFQYLMLCICFVLVLPILILKEPHRKEEHQLTLNQWKNDMVTVFNNKAAIRLFFSTMGILSLGMITPVTNTLFQ